MRFAVEEPRTWQIGARLRPNLKSALEGSNYEGLGWNVFDASDQLDPRVGNSIQKAIAKFVRSGGPTSGDELTFFMTREIMRKFSPQVMVVAFSDVEAAHFGSYALHTVGHQDSRSPHLSALAGDRSESRLSGKTTMVVLPEFGRDPDGSSTNGFFNHRANDDSTRDTWMMALGAAVDKPQIIERPIRHVDICPTLASLLGCPKLSAQGQKLEEIRS